MGTRGCYGFRKNGVDKLNYNQYDSYPDGLGFMMAEFCAGMTVPELNQLYDAIVVKGHNDKPTEDEIRECIKYNLVDLTVSRGSTDDWYCLLRNIQGELMPLWNIFKKGGTPYMYDAGNFMRDSLFCEYAYIINLDTNMLEFWEGFQKAPQEGNRYGTEVCPDYSEAKYYPCALRSEFPLDGDFSNVVDMMNSLCD